MLMVVPIISFGQGNLPAVTVDVYQFISPIIPDSPNSAQTVANFYNGVQNGNWPAGSSLTPAFVSLIPNGGSVSVLQTLYTPAFHSWNGLANPSGAFAGEYCQNVQYAFVIHSLSLFTLSQVGYTNTASGSATDSGTFAGLHYGPNTGSGGVTGGPTYSTGNGDTTRRGTHGPGPPSPAVPDGRAFDTPRRSC